MLRVTSSVLFALIFMGLSACSGGGGEPGVATPGPAGSLVADAGRDQSVFAGSFVTLNGSKSTNANQTGLSYAWALAKPAGSNAGLSNPNIANPTMTVDVEGTYTATLVVTDAQNPSAKSSPDTALVVASKTNPPPAANAGDDRSVFVGQVVTLNGSGSSDANSDRMRFNWNGTRREDGSTVALSDRTTVAPSFTPDKPGTYIIQLVVNDGTSDSTPDSVTITASDKPSPTVRAGADQFVSVNPSGPVTLDGSASQTNPPTNPPDLKYEWSINASTFPNLSLQDVRKLLKNFDKPVATLDIPANTAGTVTAQLKVTDNGNLDSGRNTASSTVNVTVGPLAIIRVSKIISPTARIPLFTCSAFTIPSCSASSAAIPTTVAVELDATSSIPSPLTYKWFEGTETFSTDAKTTRGLNSDGAHLFKLIVTLPNDQGRNLSDTQSFSVTAQAGPIANFTVPPSNLVTWKKEVTLENTSSGTNLGFEWTLTNPKGVTSTATSPSLTFTADPVGAYQVTLKATDTATSATHSKSVMITANNAPSAVISEPGTLRRCDLINLNGNESKDDDASSNPGADGVNSYSWRITEKPSTTSNPTFTGTDSATPSFKADQHGRYTIELTVTDRLGATSPSVTRQLTTRGFDIYNTTGLTPIEPCKNCHGSKVPALTGVRANIDKLQNAVTADPTPKSGSVSMGGPTTTVDSNDISDLSDYLKSGSGCP